MKILASPNDEITFEALSKTVDTGEMVAFVGAGMSMRAGFNNWSGLLADLYRATRKRDRQQRQHYDKIDELKDFTWRAEMVRDEVPESVYWRLLKEFFNKPGKPDVAIATFARLKFDHIFTTNYDLSVEQAIIRQQAGISTVSRKLAAVNWLTPGSSSEVMRSFGQLNAQARYLVYLHGRADQPETIVLSERDYRALYIRSDETVRKLFAIFSMRQVVFFGFSLEDLDVLSIFRHVLASSGDARHFALLPDNPAQDREISRNRLAQKFGINPIYYQPGGPRHPNFARLIDLLDPTRQIGGPTAVTSHQTSRRRKLTRKWTESREFKSNGGKADPEDYQKGRFGGLDRCNGRVISAEVVPDDETKDWFQIKIEVRAEAGFPPLAGRVDFWLHPTFRNQHLWSRVVHGRARLTVRAYGAFTVGAVADAGRTPLELDLSEVPGAPHRFRIA